MTKSQIDALSIGKPEAWEYDHPSPRSEESAIGYRINGLASPLSAKVAGFGKNWDFYIFRGAEPMDHPKNSYNSKEEAFAALKDWLGKSEST